MEPTREVRGGAASDAGDGVATVIADERGAGSDARAGPEPGPLDPATFERELRGRLYQELDLLAFALEMESAEALGHGDEAQAARAQQTRLGIRLAQRLVGGVPAPEVDRRLDRWRRTYLEKFPF